MMRSVPRGMERASGGRRDARSPSVTIAALACGLIVTRPALADPDAGPPDAAVSPAPAVAPLPPSKPSPPAYTTCTPYLGDTKVAPNLSERFPERGTSGYVAELEVEVGHGRGERVLPSGYRIKLGEELRTLERTGFFLPDPDGGAGPSMQTADDGDQAKTTLRIPFLLLPPEPGRRELTLPPIPIAVARASGAVITLCTEPHTIVVDEPIANDPDPKPRGNPGPRPQLEEWTAAKHAAIGALAALILGALAVWLAAWWRRRPKPVPPPPPPRPPWEVALEELFDIEHSKLVEQGRLAAHYDRVSHAVRKYLGERYGFDGLECTTHEIMSELRRIVPAVPVLPEVETFLHKADLVKFAKATPTEAECVGALERGREIVNRTTPEPAPAPPAATVDDDAREPRAGRGEAGGDS